MTSSRHQFRARTASGTPGNYSRLDASEDTAAYLEDAAHYPGGSCAEVCLPRSEADVAEILRNADLVLPVGAQSSLTGGATPRGGTVISTSRMNRIVEWLPDGVRVQSGCILASLDEELADRGFYYPPAPTFDGATVGGIVSTNAAGAATFKYGTTRDWVRAITVVLANGDVLDIERGERCASPDGCFELETTDGTELSIHLPTYTMPDVPKLSAGYHAAPNMDLIDLFIGSEGTLGFVVEVELALSRPRPGWLVGLAQLADDTAAVALVEALRKASETRALDVAAIEYMDARCLELLREDGHAQRLGFSFDENAGASVLYQVEVPSTMTRGQAEAALAEGLDSGAGPFAALMRVLKEHDAIDGSVHALPGDEKRRRELFELREAVPEAVNRRIKQAQREVDPAISKCAADVIVPFAGFEQSLMEYRRLASDAGLDLAVWGHISDGNVHPNLLPRSAAEFEAARAVLFAMGEAAVRLDGSPMSEHGVGRNAIKQRLLRSLYGETGVAQMKAVKQVLDPQFKLAPGVLFTA